LRADLDPSGAWPSCGCLPRDGPLGKLAAGRGRMEPARIRDERRPAGGDRRNLDSRRLRGVLDQRATRNPRFENRASGGQAFRAAGGAFPFGLRRKAHAERAGEGVRFVPAHSHDGLIWTEIVAPCLLVPESRSGYGIRFPPLPAGVAPYAAIAVPATVHECVEL